MSGRNVVRHRVVWVQEADRHAVLQARLDMILFDDIAIDGEAVKRRIAALCRCA